MPRGTNQSLKLTESIWNWFELTKVTSWHVEKRAPVYLWMSREALLLWERNRFHKEEEEEEEEEALEDWNYIFRNLYLEQEEEPSSAGSEEASGANEWCEQVRLENRNKWWRIRIDGPIFEDGPIVRGPIFEMRIRIE